MQLSSITPFAPSTTRVEQSTLVASAPAPATSAPRVAAPWAALSVEGATDGVARLGQPWSTPIIDFPGIEAGDQFDIAKGSKVGFLGVRGDAEILDLDDDFASFQIRAGSLGVRVDVVVDVERTGEDTVLISSRGSGIPNTSAEGRIIAQRRNYVEFERIDDPSERTIIRHDGRGKVVIDTVVPTFGKAHLILNRR
jgi:hypothetical protein